MLSKATVLATVLGLATAVPYAINPPSQYEWEVSDLIASCGYGTIGRQCSYAFDITGPKVLTNQYPNDQDARDAFKYHCAAAGPVNNDAKTYCTVKTNSKAKRYSEPPMDFAHVKSVQSMLQLGDQANMWVEVIFQGPGSLITYDATKNATYDFFHLNANFQIDPYRASSEYVPPK